MNLTAILLSFLTGFSPKDSLPEIDNVIYAFMAENNVPGISLAITKDEKPVYIKGYGFADKQKRIKVTPESLFRIASISKPVTAVAIMKLVDEKKLSLDDKVFGPKGILKNKYGKKPYTKDITAISVRHLLQHVEGGWGNSRNDPMFTDPSRNFDELISFTLDSFALENKPGAHYAYSNFGYCVLGRVIEQITGQGYEEYVKKNILIPSGATTMSVGGNTLDQKKPEEVIYYGQGRENPYVYNISRMDAHGGWIASATDLVNFINHVDGNPVLKDIISPASRKLMLTPSEANHDYACGWVIDSTGLFWHNGSLPGTRTELRHYPNGYAYALLLNTRSWGPDFDKGLKKVLEKLEDINLPTDPSAKITVPGYQPAMFMDSNRIIRMQAAFPVIDKMYKDFAGKNKVPGLAYAVVADGQVIHSGALGYSDVEKQTPLTTSSVYRIASMTKSFAAMAIIQLRDQGKLKLDDPVAKYIPEINQITPLTNDSPPITIRHLITHTAGFPEDNPWADRQLQRTDQELLDFIKNNVSLSSTPGMAYEYSNLGFAMLGTIITRASGQHYEKYIRENIFAPLGMNHTYWEYTETPADRLVNGYRLVNGKWEKEKMLHSGAYGVMGGMLTSIDDFTKYMNLHLQAWPPKSDNDTAFIKRSSIREMHLPGNISNLNAYNRKPSGEICPKISSYNFGLGWSKDCADKVQIGHSGGLPGFGTHWTFLPDYGVGIVSFCNLTYAATIALNNQLMDTIVAIADLQPRKLLPSSILKQRKKELLNLLPEWNNAMQAGIFSENFFDDNFVDSLRKTSKSLFEKAGKIINIGEIIPDNQLRGNFIIEGEQTNILVRFTLSPENPGLIQQFIIREQPKSDDLYKKYGLKTISTIAEYKELIAKDPNQALVRLDKFIPNIKLDIRYATSNNLTERPLYNIPTAFMRKPAAESLKKIQQQLNKMGLGLKIYDGYRPYSVTVQFYETFRDTVFVASPYTGSRHNRGCAVDLTIINLKTGKELTMPTPYDAFDKKAHTDYVGLPAEAHKNRELLKKVMTSNGFVIYPDEWWHYDFNGWQNYPVINIPFESLINE